MCVLHPCVSFVHLWLGPVYGTFSFYRYRFRESRALTPRKDEAYCQQIFSYKTTDGASDTINKEKCYYLGTNQSFNPSCANHLQLLKTDLTACDSYLITGFRTMGDYMSQYHHFSI